LFTCAIYSSTFRCFLIEFNNSKVCNGNGKKKNKKIKINIKKIIKKEIVLHLIIECQNPIFYSKPSYDINSCSGISKGKCISPDNCTFNPGYSSNDCSLYYCNNTKYNDSIVYSGNENCILTDTCSCNCKFENYSKFSNKFLNNQKVLQFANYCFDVSDIFSTLCFGSTLFIPKEEIRKNIDELINFIEKNEITIFEISPSLLKLLPQKKLKNVKKLLISGESCDFKTMKFWSNNVKQIINSYGPTETTVTSNNFFWNENNSQKNIGKPIYNFKNYILNKNLKQVPIGIVGELYIGGEGLARGYLNRNDLTNERFIINPFEENSKLYKTGDLARFLENGDVEYIGRIDNQIKLRGLRIELDEIEIEIKKISNILNCVVILREDEINEKYLASYLILRK
jgi:hypothetical protein